MSSTYAPQAAADYATTYIKSMPFYRVSTQVLDDVNKMMWMAAPWRWSVGTFPTVTLTANTQDYTVALPSDFLYLQDVYETDALGNPVREYTIESWLPSGGKFGIPSHAAIVSGSAGSNGTLRVSPQPGGIPSSQELVSIYKKKAPIITASNVNTPGTLVFDDEWFWVYESGVLYFAYLYGDDQRAGGAQTDPLSGKVTYNEQRGVFEANLLIMKQREKLALDDADYQQDQKAQY